MFPLESRGRQPAGDNPCSNGSFEVLAANGFPADWGPVGRDVSVSANAHSGGRALRMVRAADTPTPETGLNRVELITELKGGMEFWYQAVAAGGARLNVYVIPVDEQGVERTGSARATFTVPEDHIGDGRWHPARLKYDYTDNPKVKAVHFAARIVGTSGELLLDDVQYVPRVGPIPLIKTLTFDEDSQSPGRRGRLRVLVTNAGDQPAEEVHVTLQLPPGMKSQPEEAALPLAPDEIRPLYFELTGTRDRAGGLTAAAACGELGDARRLDFKPRLRVRSFGPREPVTVSGQPAVLECELENTGKTVLSGITVTFATPPGPARQTAGPLAPTERVVVRHSFVPDAETPRLPVAVHVAAPGVPIEEAEDGEWAAESGLTVVKALQLAPPQDRFSFAPRPVPILENDSFRLIFYPCRGRFFATRLEVKTPQGWKVAGWFVSMGRLVLRDSQGRIEEHLLAADSCLIGPTPAKLRGVLRFPSTVRTASGVTVTAETVFSTSPAQKTCAVQAVLKADQAVDIAAWGLPMLYILERDEAIFPGLEWLVDDELSSDSLDIAADHPDRIRHVVHPDMITAPAAAIHGPHGTVGMFFGPAGMRPSSEPSARGMPHTPAFAFASPDRFLHQRSHRMEVFLPPVPEFTPVNSRIAEKPFRLEPGEELTMQTAVVIDGRSHDALNVIEDYVRIHKPDPAHPLPHVSLAGEVEFSAQAYLESLWDAETREWWTSKGSALLSRQGLPPGYAADLVLVSMLTHDETLRNRCRERVEEVCGELKLPPRLDALRTGGRADRAWADAAAVAALLAARREDGSWRFDADRPGSGPFLGMDYRELGPHEALEVGTCARNAYQVLRFARITADQALYQEMVKTLELMERFRVPRAAQVWEVPVHTPDVLAAADAVDAYLEAYRLSGEKRWLDDAVLWAKRGLPFIYFRSDPQKPYLQGASIPVFGATWYRGSWFGRPVQWNGLRYAEALLKLAEYDRSLPWRETATIIIHSACHQQDQEGENVALWPDSISAITGEKSAWVFAPRQIIGCIGKLIGRDEEPRTVYHDWDGGRAAITSLGKIDQVSRSGGDLSLTVAFPPGEVGPILVANVGRPQAVLIDGLAAPQDDQPHLRDGSAWCYDSGTALLTVQVGVTGPAKVTIKPAVFQTADRVPRLAESIDFSFEAGLEGWIAAHDVADLTVQDGRLWGRITGPDPYIVRSNLRVPADKCNALVIRMSTTAGNSAQLFWATRRDPAFDETKSLRFAVQPGEELHEYRLDLRDRPQWRGEEITALRLDPGGGTPQGTFAVDAVSAETGSQ
ncbi:MAG: hypothetical protein GYA33_15245 [Thermogutta sp.]|nr:hypothetical protein [Thermogutta sp.]